jgi:hypothetical protein
MILGTAFALAMIGPAHSSEKLPGPGSQQWLKAPRWNGEKHNFGEGFSRGLLPWQRQVVAR